jgi:hypothetical protein
LATTATEITTNGYAATTKIQAAIPTAATKARPIYSQNKYTNRSLV